MKIPKLAIAQTLNGGMYAVAGFDLVDTWACQNDPMWKRLTIECQQNGFQEEDRIKILAVALLREKHGQQLSNN